MNLIEQLGGYDAAKSNIRELVSDYGDGVTRGSKLYDFDFNVGQVQDALLQYRRQHNIFEVGDKVVFKNVEKFKDNMLQIAHVELQKVLDIKSGLNGYTSFDEIRHAEPEELEAGKRLEVKSDS